ncbi:hypothetical protein C2G38_2192268 [Gigaspora rosea]|uniref:Uncharacterized protein n=1 Tax=Gigaspora rosea TaxID=44941 RepID=A0A397V1N5_9GLOM|nr:hypothetical protein C2G38_2192268 [Gigaspora rosea]
MNSALRTQKRNKNDQDTSSSASKKTSKYNGKNEKQQNNNVASSLSESTSIKNINQRREDYDDAASTNYKNTNITSQVSLSDNESDNSSIVSSPIYENNETTSPQSVSFAHENNEATSSHPVSSVHETDVSLPQENDIALPAYRSDNSLQKQPAQFQQKQMITRLDEGDEEHVTTSVSSILHEPTLKLPEIDQEEPYDELNEFVTNNVWKQLLQMHLKATDQTKLKKDSEIFTQLKNFVHQVIKAVLIAKDNHKDTQNAIRKCDEYTIDLEIPTKFGIVKSLPVRELLNC